METVVDYLESMVVLDPRHIVQSMETPEVITADIESTGGRLLSLGSSRKHQK